MAFDGYFVFGDVEIGNKARTKVYAETLGLETVWIAGNYSWMEEVLSNYSSPLVDQAPWYDPDQPLSNDFGGVLITAAEGIDASTSTADVVEFVGDGGRAGHGRNATKTIVFSAALVGKTEAAVEYGLRWLKQALKRRNCVGTSKFCLGEDLYYWRARYQGEPGTIDVEDFLLENDVHLRDVTFTRGPVVTRKRTGPCDTVWTVTFTAVAGDPYEYGTPVPILSQLNWDSTPYIPPFSGTEGVTFYPEEACPQAIWTPIYDPLYPTAVPPPAPPDYYPEGWVIHNGNWNRAYADIPHSQIPLWTQVVPFIRLYAHEGDGDARGIRVRLYPQNAAYDDACGYLWEAIVAYIPEGWYFYIDGVQRTAYLWDGVSDNVRRADSLLYGTDAKPVTWPALSCDLDMFITIDHANLPGDEADVSLDFTLIGRND